MRLARKLFLFVMAAVAAMAFAASGASAQGVALTIEDDGPCPAVGVDAHVVTGGCDVHATSTVPATLFSHVAVPNMEVPFSACDNEFDAKINSAGSGQIFNQVLTDPDPANPTCGLEPCDEAEPSHANVPWPATVREANGQLLLNTTFCVRTAGTEEGTAGTPCNVDILITDLDNHAYEFTTDLNNNPADGVESPCINLGGAVELRGHWLTEEPGTNVEINHS